MPVAEEEGLGWEVKLTQAVAVPRVLALGVEEAEGKGEAERLPESVGLRVPPPPPPPSALLPSAQGLGEGVAVPAASPAAARFRLGVGE